MCAMSSGAGPGGATAGWVARAGSSMATTATPCPSSRDRSSVVVSAAIGAASASMNSIRAAGCAGSMGR
ncbi:hypothetical protein MYSI104531_24555 [Mycobacterium simiae]